MESLETAELFIDNLLDFSLDIGEEEEDDADKKTALLASQNHHLQPQQQPLPELNAPQSDSIPSLIEEDLEWLSNSDAFPPIETCDILCETKPKNDSPVSVLGSSNLHIPVQARSKRRRKRRSNFLDSSGRKWWWCCEPKRRHSEGSTSFVRKCLHCHAEETPQWRAGPLGPKTLCNACGVRYKSGRLFPEYRPANSPTFSSRLHSNSHRKILDMRRQKQKDVWMHPLDNGR